MAEEVKMFKSSDGRLFKTKKGAENRDKKIEVAKVVESLSMTEDEIAERLSKVAPYNVNIRGLLKMEADWRKWPKHLIVQVNEKILAEPEKKTTYVMEYYAWGEKKEKEIAVETGADFADVKKYLGDGPEKYKVKKTELVDSYNLKVFYDYEYTEEEQISMKLKAGEKLSEDEIEFLVYEMDEVYEEEGDEGRWERYMTTVIEIDGEKYAIEWSRGLTESQENYFYEQPYPVEVVEKEVTVTQITIERK